MSDLLIGVDIGGTKCAVVLGNTVPEILDRVEFPTNSESGPEPTIKKIETAILIFLISWKVVELNILE